MIVSGALAGITGTAMQADAAIISIVPVICLIMLLITRELTCARLEEGGHNSRIGFFAKILDIAIAPFLLAFFAIVAMRILEILKG